jgi:hypothetical protein
MAGSRIREGLAVSDEIVSQVLEHSRRSGFAQPGMLTAAQEEDTWGDLERVAFSASRPLRRPRMGWPRGGLLA